MASTTLSEMSHDYANYYEKAFRAAYEVSPLDIQDDRTKDVIVVIERYAMAQFWKEGERTLVPGFIARLPGATGRHAPRVAPGCR